MPTITSRGDLVRYVVMVTIFALVVSLTADLSNQVIFFTSWAAVLRTGIITTVTVCVVAIPVAWIFGNAQRELQAAKRRLEAISRTDPLTGLPNRRALIEAIDSSGEQTMVMVLADIDQFNAINDAYGHRTGDLVLQTLARTIEAHLSDYGLVGHMRGEEFALISSSAPLERIVDIVGDMLRAVERTPFLAAGGSIQITISAGIAIRGPGDTFEKLYGEADEALHAAKRMGRSHIKLSDRARDTVLAGQSAERMSLILKL
ncbi:diguanylate cyclase (GGDEF)-like protein [Microvirga flocculans]|uniref:diguanylate cyclase n=1 Tax=Microvirga flocculans TaxID=217168 RepID=A0A7W6IHN6_9HYPH|nr:GGDEF domain-containing protein [Microvirga flocculans]MBB4041690.1 diguanylate cyclase (GGDEF)-like protein [Microvirga flocculans]